MRKQTWLLILIIVAGVAMLGGGGQPPGEPVSGATYIGLALGGRLEVYDTRVVPETTVRLACPGQAIINVWPSPKGKLWCPECIDNFWKQLDWGEVLPEINLP